MTNKTTKRALFSSVVALFLCFAMLLGTTYAWFTDSVSSASNVITAGNLDVELKYAKVVDGNITDWDTVAGKDNIFDKNALWEPGRVEVVYLQVSNLGSLALKYQLGVNVYNETPATNMDGKEFKLSDHLVFTVVEMPDALTTYTDREAATIASGSEKGLKDYNGKTTALEVGGVDYVALIVYMPETVGNEANFRGTAPSITLGINLFATQQSAEGDSFGDDYDKDANPVFVSDAAELEAALTATDVRDIVLTKDVTLAEAVKVTTDKVIDFNGKNFTAESGSRPFQVYGADITINAIGSKVEMDTYGLIDIREGADVKVSITGGTFTGELDNGSVIKGRAGTKAEIYLKDVNMTFTDKSTGSTNGSYIYNPVKGASATTTIDGGVYNIDCGVIGDIVIKNATINAKGFIFNGGGSIENSVLTTDGSSKAPFGDAPFCCVAVSGNRTATVTGSTLTATNCNAIEVYPTGGVVTVVDSTVTGACYKHPLYDANDKCSITINGVEQ